MILYISGAITKDPNYLQKFQKAEDKYKDKYEVINPARLCCEYPKSFCYADYMDFCKLFVEKADAILLLPDWSESPGAKFEYATALSLGKQVLYEHSDI